VRLRGAVAIGILSVTASLAPAARAAPAPRILYAGDWTGTTQIFAADPSGRAPLRQVTFARSAGPCYWAAACGFTRPLPSPDGRRLAYWSGGIAYQPQTLWLARADGTGARAIGQAQDAAWAPDSRRLAYSAPDGVHVLTTTGVDRIVDSRSAGKVRWSADGKTLAFVAGSGLTLRRGGRERVLVSLTPTSFAWSSDGRRIAYGTQEGIFLVGVTSGRARLIYRLQEADHFQFWRLELAFAPTGRLLAFTFGGEIRTLAMRTLRVRRLRAAGHDIAWSPNGRSLLYIQGGESTNGDAITTGDVQTVTPSGRIRTVVSASKPYGGQLVAAAWTIPARGVRYRAPQAVDGIFAGGPVQELVADGARAAFVACGGVSAWTPATGAILVVENKGECRATYSRGHVYSLGLAGDRVVWWEKGWGLCFQWNVHQATLGAPSVELGAGTGCLGSPPTIGTGTAVGAGSLLVRSAWKLHHDNGSLVVDEQTIERVEPGGCPCPAVSSSPGPYTPLDVDAGRIVVSGQNETRILAADSTILLSLPVPTLAAQLSGSDLVLTAGGELRVYDADSGARRATWPLPAQPAGHDCDLFGDPSCLQPARLRVGDVAHGLAAYVLDGQVHLLRLVDGADEVVGPGMLARFADAGLVYADGARIRLVPFERLPLR
jgi:WD40 repeat protein